MAMLPAQKLNGKLTLGENTADNGGLRIAYMALLDTLAAEGKSIDDKIDGYTEAQRYFLGFAQVWCENQTEQSARQSALTDPHSPGRWRVNGTVQNFDAFGKAFGCKKGQPMFPVELLPGLVDHPWSDSASADAAVPPGPRPIWLTGVATNFTSEQHFRRPSVDFSFHSAVQASNVAKIASQISYSLNWMRRISAGSGEKYAVLPSLRSKLGITYPWLLQCNRDPSQPSSAVELANLAAHA